MIMKDNEELRKLIESNPILKKCSQKGSRKWNHYQNSLWNKI